MIPRFLGPFEKATLATEGRNATLEKALPAMDLLISHYNNANLTSNPVFARMLINGRAKLKKYYIIAKSSAPYITAVVLNPRLKWCYFEDRWSEADIKQAKEILKSFWLSSYRQSCL